MGFLEWSPKLIAALVFILAWIKIRRYMGEGKNFREISRGLKSLPNKKIEIENAAVIIGIWGIFLAILMSILWHQIDTGYGMELLFLGVLVIVTMWYAAHTKRMANEMKKQRYDSVRPAIDIEWADESEKARDTIRVAIDKAKGAANKTTGDNRDAKEEQPESELPTKLNCKLSSIGLGTATNVYSFIQAGVKPSKECYRLRNLGRPEKGGIIPLTNDNDKWPLFLAQRNGNRFLVVYYFDIYGRCFESIRKVTRDENGTLTINPPKTTDLNKEVYIHLVEGNYTTFVDKLWPPSERGGETQ